MTAGQLIDYVRTLVGPASVGMAPGHLLNLLNIAQDEVSREARMPRKVVQYSGLTADNQMVLPSDARTEGLIEVHALSFDGDGALSNSRPLQIFDYVSAARYHPSWATWEGGSGPSFVVYDPAHTPACPRPVPAPTADAPASFRVLYIARPADLSSLSDLVFGGKFSGLATVVAYRVAYLLTRDQAMYGEYERALRALVGQSRHPTVMVKNPLYLANLPLGER